MGKPASRYRPRWPYQRRFRTGRLARREAVAAASDRSAVGSGGIATQSQRNRVSPVLWEKTLWTPGFSLRKPLIGRKRRSTDILVLFRNQLIAQRILHQR